MNTTKNHLTYEKARQRYVFQLRVPVNLRPSFEGRETIRKSLGSIPHEEAVARANELATHYLSEFDRLRPAPADTPAARITVLDVTARTGHQLAATWQRRAINDLTAQLERLQSAPETDWETAISDGQAALKTAREELRRGNFLAFNDVLTTLQHQHGFVLNSDTAELAVASRQFNAVRVAYLASVLDVLAGTQGVDAVTPPRDTQLPLLCLWGTAAKDLPELWASRKRSIGQEPNLKTLDKYRLIAGDCDSILNGRPVEDLRDADLTAIKARWCAQDNGPSTVICKLDLLKQLVRLLGANERLEACFQSGRPVGGKLKTKRLPFTRDQVCTWVNAVNADASLSEDDKMLVHLLLLTAARLEEMCQLTASDIATDQGHWHLRIASGQDTSTEAGIKNPASARRLMIPMGVLPRLDTWLSEHVTAGGSIFPDLTEDKYGCLGTAVSKRLNRRLRKLLGPDRRLVLLSSRPTGNRVMRRAGVDPRVRYRQLGHADQGIHDRHYDAAEHFDDEDLLPAAAIMAEWLASCIEPDALPEVDGQVLGNNAGLTEPDMHVRDESAESARTAQQISVEHGHLPVQFELAQVRVVPQEAFKPASATSIDARGFRTLTGGDHDVPGGFRQNELNRVVSPSRRSIPGTQMHVGLEADAGELQDACDDQLRSGPHGTAGGRVPIEGAERDLGGNSFEESMTQCLSVHRRVDVTPDLEASSVLTARQVESGRLGLDSDRLIESKQVDDGFQTPCPVQVFTGIRVPLPQFFDGADAGVEEDRQKVHGRHLLKGATAQTVGQPTSAATRRRSSGAEKSCQSLGDTMASSTKDVTSS